MNAKTKLLFISASLTLAIAGCQQPQRRPTAVAAHHEQTISIEELAARLALRIEERDPTFVILKNSANTVLIFTQTDGRFFVNGKPIGPVGAVQKIGGTIYVPDALASAIQPYLQGPMAAKPPVVVPTPSPRRKTGVVVVDAGHGGKDPGTMVGGTDEKHITLQVAKRLAAVLTQQGATVVMTRQDDRFIELEDRADLANRRGADLFVSIHCDSSPDRTIRGFTIYVAREASREAYRLAQSVSAAMTQTGSDTRGIREADYKVLVLTKCPAVLVELGYLSNSSDARRLQDAAYQARLAQALADGILATLR
jgi:N-acetylmuramoyl-L-alanine amidase